MNIKNNYENEKNHESKGESSNVMQKDNDTGVINFSMVDDRMFK